MRVDESKIVWKEKSFPIGFPTEKGHPDFPNRVGPWAGIGIVYIDGDVHLRQGVNIHDKPTDDTFEQSKRLARGLLRRWLEEQMKDD